MRTYLEALTDQELLDRLNKLVKMGDAIGERINAGERGDAVSTVVRAGRFENSYALENSLNGIRSAWSQTKREIDNRSEEGLRFLMSYGPDGDVRLKPVMGKSAK
jgi:hypothetical protein